MELSTFNFQLYYASEYYTLIIYLLFIIIYYLLLFGIEWNGVTRRQSFQYLLQSGLVLFPLHYLKQK